MAFSALALILSLATFGAVGQATGEARPSVPAQDAPPPSAGIRQALSNVQSTTANLNISRWKTSRGVRTATQGDVDSIQRDVSQTLPGLLAAADAAPGSVPPSFALYRNVDALYDVLLRVSEVADFSASEDEAGAIASSLQELERARARLGDAISLVSQQRETQVREFEAAIRAAKAERAAPKREIVVEDGPVKKASSARRREERRRMHKKHVEKHPPEKPAAEAPAAASH